MAAMSPGALADDVVLLAMDKPFDVAWKDLESAVKGNKMGLVFARGIPGAQDREDLIAYLREATAQ